MNILIITSFFPPDRAIASVRPYMFAKYLRQMGHQITVLYPGDCSRPQDSSMGFDDLDISICAYLKKDNPTMDADLNTRSTVGTTKKMAYLPEPVRSFIKKYYYIFRKPVDDVKMYRDAKRRFAIQKEYIDGFQDQHFDVVFATYGNLENVFAGKYAADKLKCKLVFDVRDPVASFDRNSLLGYYFYRKVQRNAVQAADICTVVSEGVGEQLCRDTNKEVVTLYNGYDENNNFIFSQKRDDILRFCYTGIMYNNRSAAALFCAIRKLADDGKLDMEKVRLDYAGPHFEMLLNQAKIYGAEQVLVNHGLVSREEAAAIQYQSDIFLVLSWNTKHEKGVLTGKFYEGIRARKPILSIITGNVPNSELMRLNQKYRYGMCYEEYSQNIDMLYQWVKAAYRQKQAGENVEYNPANALFTDFRYDKLSEKLEKVCIELHYRNRTE